MDPSDGTRAPTEAPPPPLPGALEAWSDDAKRFYLALRARNVTQKKSYAQTKKVFGVKVGEGAAQQNLSRWEQREDVKVYLAWQRGQFKTDLKKLPFAQKWERVAGYGQLCLVLLERFEKEERSGTPSDLTKLSAEVRQLWREIRAEVEGLGLDDSRVPAEV